MAIFNSYVSHYQRVPNFDPLAVPGHPKDDDVRPSSRRPSSLPGLASLDSQGAVLGGSMGKSGHFFIGEESNMTIFR